MKKKEIKNKIKEIGQKYGINIWDNDIHYNKGKDLWYILPYEGESGFSCQDGIWWGERIDSSSVRYMDGDWDMFDEIADYLNDVIYEEDD